MAKRKKNENNEELENFYDVFMRNYKNVPGFQSLIKLTLYGIFIAIIIIVALSSRDNDKTNSAENSKTSSTTTTTVAVEKENITYKDILNKTKIKKEIKITIKENNDTYIIEAINEDNTVIGYFETKETTKRFKIKDDNIYELKLEKEIKDDNLFGNINYNYVVPEKLINIIENNLANKQIKEKETIYLYQLKKNENIKVHVVEDEIPYIEIDLENINYMIEYK